MFRINPRTRRVSSCFAKGRAILGASPVTISGQRVRQRVRDRSPVAPDRDRLLPPPGRALSAVHVEDRLDRPRFKHQKAAYCGLHYFDSDAYPPEYRQRLYMGNIHGDCINVDTLKRDGSTYAGRAGPRFSDRQRRLVHAGLAEDGARRLSLHPRLVRPLPLLSGRRPRSRGDRPPQGSAVSRPLPRYAPGCCGSIWQRKRRAIDRAAGQPQRLFSRSGPANALRAQRSVDSTRGSSSWWPTRRPAAPSGCTRCGH